MLTVKALSVKYSEGTEALKNVSFELAAGENVALIGANGAGKSTLMLSLVGLTDFCGEIRLGQELLNEKTKKHFRDLTGVVFQDPNDQLFMPTVREDIAFGLRNRGLSPEEKEKRTIAAVNQLGIASLLDKSVLKMSGGEKRLVAIAGVLVMKPALILFDEPTAFLDPKAKRTLVSLLRALPAAKLIATHDYEFAKALCPRTLLLSEGKLAADGLSNILLEDEALLTANGL